MQGSDPARSALPRHHLLPCSGCSPGRRAKTRWTPAGRPAPPWRACWREDGLSRPDGKFGSEKLLPCHTNGGEDEEMRGAGDSLSCPGERGLLSLAAQPCWTTERALGATTSIPLNGGASTTTGGKAHRGEGRNRKLAAARQGEPRRRRLSPPCAPRRPSLGGRCEKEGRRRRKGPTTRPEKAAALVRARKVQAEGNPRSLQWGEGCSAFSAFRRPRPRLSPAPNSPPPCVFMRTGF